MAYLITKLFPNGSKFLTMSTPGRVELDEGIATAVSHQFLEVLANSYLDWAVVLLRYGFRLHEGL